MLLLHMQIRRYFNKICDKPHYELMGTVILTMGWLGLCCLSPLSTIFQLYRGSQSY
jgi:hypothetical protein